MRISSIEEIMLSKIRWLEEENEKLKQALKKLDRENYELRKAQEK